MMKERDFHDRQKRKEEREARDEQVEGVEMFVAAVMATDTDIRIAMVERDMLDVATVEALIANREELEKVQDELRIMRDRAFVLPDGRRVFKTEDGTRIFDESGAEVTGFDPDEIEDSRPTWEALQGLRTEEEALTAERTALLQYQARLDEARERLDAGEIGKDELDAMMADLRTDIPDAVRAHLPEDAAPVQDVAPDLPVATAAPLPLQQPAPTARLDMPTL